jgi:Spy/CpxP family protein refolding chaperone
MKQLFRRSVLLSLAAVCVAMILSQAATAQEGRRGGRGFGMGFGVPLVRLAANEEVQQVLKLNDEQKGNVDDLNDELRDEFRDLLQGGAEREEMQALVKSGSEKLNEILDDAQEKRLTEITIQAFGVNAVLFHPTLGEQLKVTDEQREELNDVQRENAGAMRDAFQDMQDLSQEERRAKFDELRADADKKLTAVLTDEQRSQLESLKGEKVDIDISQLRGFGGRGGGRGGRDRDRDRDGGGRQREEQTQESTSTSN